MSEENRKEFEDRFSKALSASLGGTTAPDGLRARLLNRLQEETGQAPPASLTEEGATLFERKLAQAVERSQEWAPEDKVALEAEAALSAEMKENVLSERSVGALLDGKYTPASLKDVSTPPEKIRFVRTVRAEIKRSTCEVTAPQEVRDRLTAALEKERGTNSVVALPSKSKVVSMPSRSTWKRGLAAVGSLAAGFAVVFLTLFGSAETALANSVAADHRSCCRRAEGMEGPAPAKYRQMLEAKYGNVPVPEVRGDWDLKISQICPGEDGQPMVHFLYTRPAGEGKLDTMSLHFIPKENKKDSFQLDQTDVHEVTKADIPMIAWGEGDWICTACSSELDAETLMKVVSKA